MASSITDSKEMIVPSEGTDGGLTKSLVFLTFFSALGGFLFGYDTGVVSGAMLLIRKEFHLSTLWQEMIVSVAIVAAWLAALMAGPATDWFGRRLVILLSSVVFTVGSIVLGLAPNKIGLLSGRAIVGVGIGLSSMCIPMYISEVAPLSVRGRLTVTNTIFLTGGQFVASVVCGLFSGVDDGWRWMLGLGAVPSFIQMIAFLFLAPESPRWLSMQSRFDEAQNVLKRFRPPNSNTEKEMDEFRKSPSQVPGFKTILGSSPVRRALILGCLLQLYQQISGINTVMYYSASIIAMAGISNDQVAIWLTAVTSFFNFSFTFVGLWLVERLGRRPLTLYSIFGVALSLLTLALSFHLAAIYSPAVMTPGVPLPSGCSQYSWCSSCTEDPSCGFCFTGNETDIASSFCLKANQSQYNQISTFGMCSDPSDSDAVFAFNWCPTQFAWLSILGLCLYLCCFAPGMGTMPWSINSEIYPNWARARCTSVATSVNWAANLVVSLTFLSLTELITKYGAFYLYMCFALSGFLLFFFILPETKGVTLEDVEQLFESPMCSSQPWKKKKSRKEDSIRQPIDDESYGTL